MIELKNVSHIYNEGSPQEKYAIKDLNLTIDKNEFIGIIGHTGSGKSTLVQHLNGLMKPTRGEVFVDGIKTTDDDAVKKGLRQRVGLVFQYPEHQLFEETIEKDIAFGPKNLNLSEEEIHKRVVESMELVGLDYEEMKDRSPFDLSGGQKRRVAIAGVLAMQPSYLVLDEPTAGLDPGGRDEILDELKKLFLTRDMTIVLVSHSMEDIARLCTRVLVMHRGELAMDGPTKEVYSNEKRLQKIGLDIPEITKVVHALGEKKGWEKEDILTVEDAMEYLKKKGALHV